jgi:polycystin 1L2
VTQINGFKGFVGHGIRELNKNETYLYCSSQSIQASLPMTQNRLNFTSDFMIRSYTSGCYYYDPNTGKWSSNGMDIYEDTNLEQTHCLSNHLTAFAGGLVLTSSTINFKYALVNASFVINPIIYMTLIFFTCLYILFAVWCRVMDMKDVKKTKIHMLKDNFPTDSYFYEIIVFTGSRIESATSSRVK